VAAGAAYAHRELRDVRHPVGSIACAPGARRALGAGRRRCGLIRPRRPRNSAKSGRGA
jgi:hypothetical protein